MSGLVRIAGYSLEMRETGAVKPLNFLVSAATANKIIQKFDGYLRIILLVESPAGGGGGARGVGSEHPGGTPI